MTQSATLVLQQSREDFFLAERVEHALQLQVRIPVHGVHGLGAVQGDYGQMPLALDRAVFVSHVGTSIGWRFALNVRTGCG